MFATLLVGFHYLNMMSRTKRTTDCMANGQGSMLQPNHNVNVTNTLTKERELRPRSTEVNGMMAVPRATSLPTQLRATGPVSEQWLQQKLLPRLSRRPYETHHYFQQRITTDESTEDIPTGPAHITQPEPDRTFELSSQLSKRGKICVSPREEYFVEKPITALHEYRQHLINLASGESKKSHLQDAIVASQTQNVPQTLFEAPSPGSTVQDTEEEHKAAVEFCLSSYRSSSTKKRKDSSADGHSYKGPSKRVRSIDASRAYSEGLGAVDTNSSDCKNYGTSSAANSHESALEGFEVSVSYTGFEGNHFSRTSSGSILSTKSVDARSNVRRRCESARVCAKHRLSRWTPQPSSGALQAFANRSIPSSFPGKNADVVTSQPLKLDRDLKGMSESRYRDIELSQVIKYRGTFLGTGQIWCQVPGSWEDAVVLSNQRRM